MSQLYGMLGIATNADSAEIRAAFRRLAKACHPDLPGGDPLRFKEISGAYSTLGHAERRAAYDAEWTRTRTRAHRRRLAGAVATMAASFALTVGSGVALAGWLLGT